MKAVIMAGGEGTRLRPLTCDMPKPMAPLCGRPVMDYTLELLARHGFGDAAVTLMYMPRSISEHFGAEAHGVRLRYFVEEEPLGTAGSVKRASADFGEDFLVISGDGLCDFDLKRIMDYHKEKGGAATIVLKGMPNPLEYGLVMADSEGRVTRFLEKPDWGQALTDLVNTGVYVLSTEAMRLVPDGKPFDFGKELFPLMLEKGLAVYSYVESGYWLDIGDISTYISAQFDLLDGKVRFDVPKPPRREGVKPPVWIGENVSIAPGASVGEYAVVGDGCRIARGADVRGSVIGPGSYVGKRAELRGALVCGGCVVKADAAMYDGSVLGAGSVLSEGSVVSPNVRVWPKKRIEPNAGVYSDVVKGVSGGGLIENGLISGTIGADITPEYAARIGAAAATALKGGVAAVACDGCDGSGVIKSALIVGLLGSGAEAIDMGVLPLNVFSFGVADRGAKLGLFVTEKGIAVRDGLGLPPTRELARRLESAYRRGEFSRSGGREARADAAVFSDYARELEKLRAPFAVTVSSPEAAFSRLYSSVFPVGGSVRVRIEADGSAASLVDEDGREIDSARLLYGVCFMLATGGAKRLPLPPETPKRLAEAVCQLGCDVRVRMFCPPDKSDDALRAEAARLRVLDDAVAGCAFLLRSLAERKQRAADFFASAPDFPVAELEEDCGDRNGGTLIRLLGERESGFVASAEGLDLRRGSAVCTVKPSARGRALRLVAEANTLEAARELGAEVLDRIRAIKKELDNTAPG
ncbi:MAG: NTP transferase domain-containing protein [Clostridia bacterium]|nr:NTP transferase domain-containing protein [Clostridia bacterium]